MLLSLEKGKETMLKVTALLTISLILGIALISGCGDDRTCTISGTIVEGENISDVLGGYPGRPISGAMVFIPETSHFSITDEDGKYRLEEVPAGTYTLIVKLIYLTIAEIEVEVGPGELLRVPTLETSIPAFFIGGWGELGFYDEENSVYIGDVLVYMGPDPKITQSIRGELYVLGDEDSYLDETISLTVQFNNSNRIPVELKKNLFSYELKAELQTGKNTVLIRAINPEGGIQTRILNLYYYPSGLVASLKWEGQGDLDLHLIGPDGTICYYGDVAPDWGITEDSVSGDVDASIDDPRFHFDRRSGWGSNGETIALPNPPPGDYAVTVLFFSAGYPSLKEEPLRPFVTIYLDGEKYEFASNRLMRVDDEWVVTRFRLPGDVPEAPTRGAVPTGIAR